MARVLLSRAAPQDYRVAAFQAVASVGIALRRHLGSLMGATFDDRGRNWLDIVKQIVTACTDQFGGAGVADVEGYVEYARSHIRGLAATFRSENPQLETVLSTLAANVDVVATDALLQQLRALNEAGHQHAQRLIQACGGQLAAKRLLRMGPASLAFEESDESKALYTFMEPGRRGEIALVAGFGPGALFSWLNLEFYFMHEYVSHVFPVWDDAAGTFSEGYLFGVAKWSFLREATSPANPMLMEADWENHRRRHRDASGADFYRRVELATVWFQSQCDAQTHFPRLLLEWAALDRPDDRFHEQLLAMLRWLWNRGEVATARSVICGNVSDVVQVHDELQRRLPGLRL